MINLRKNKKDDVLTSVDEEVVVFICFYCKLELLGVKSYLYTENRRKMPFLRKRIRGKSGNVEGTIVQVAAFFVVIVTDFGYF